MGFPLNKALFGVMLCCVVGNMLWLKSSRSQVSDLPTSKPTQPAMATFQPSQLVYTIFNTFPEGASIFLDGKEIGRTSFVTNLKPGIYNIRFSLPGFQDYVTQYNVTGIEVNIFGKLGNT